MSRVHFSRRGLTLIELLVAIALSMLLMVAISGVLVRQEGARRALTSTNDVLLNGAYLSDQIDRMVRSAGSGFSQAWRTTFGCQLTAARGGAQLLPRATAWPAPFATVSQSPRLAPVIVHAGAGAGGSDVLAIASGNSGLGESPLRLLAGSATATGVRVPATVGFRAQDLVLLAEEGRTDCMLQQATAAVGQQIDFGGVYSAGTIGTLNLADFGTVGEVNVVPIGNSAGNAPSFQLLGIGSDRTLVTLDMLRLEGVSPDPAVPMADGVIEMRVRYGIDNNNDRIVDQWVSPTASPWTAADLSGASATAQADLHRILAVRVGLILRNATAERDPVTGPSLVLFPDLGAAPLSHTHSLTTDEQRFRYRVMDFTVPLRNVMLI